MSSFLICPKEKRGLHPSGLGCKTLSDLLLSMCTRREKNKLTDTQTLFSTGSVPRRVDFFSTTHILSYVLVFTLFSYSSRSTSSHFMFLIAHLLQMHCLKKNCNLLLFSISVPHSHLPVQDFSVLVHRSCCPACFRYFPHKPVDDPFT